MVHVGRALFPALSAGGRRVLAIGLAVATEVMRLARSGSTVARTLGTTLRPLARFGTGDACSLGW
jgi:hypothetical protein